MPIQTTLPPTTDGQALCADPDRVHPDDLHPYRVLAPSDRQRDMCAACPIRLQCDEHAWNVRPESGVWAGILGIRRTGPTPTRRCRCGLLNPRTDRPCHACDPKGHRAR